MGIIFAGIEESCTSKASFIDGDDIPVYDAKSDSHPTCTFSGKRISRGIY